MSEIFHQYILHPLEHTIEHIWYMPILLLLVYLLIEVLEHKAIYKVKKVLSNKSFGLFGAAALGIFPQCGFSVAVANLYAEKLVGAGAVAAVFVATSDEALPLLIANPSMARWLLPTIFIKFFFAVLVGLLVNLIFKVTKLDACKPQAHTHAHSGHTHEGGEHHHCAHCDSSRGIVRTAIRRTLSVFIFILITSFFFNVAVEVIGEENLKAFLMNGSVLQPFVAALIGLIPNCAASVIATELFISGAIGYGALIAGLSVGSGIGALVLFRVNKNIKQNLALMGILYIASALLGVIITLIV